MEHYLKYILVAFVGGILGLGYPLIAWLLARSTKCLLPSSLIYLLWVWVVVSMVVSNYFVMWVLGIDSIPMGSIPAAITNIFFGVVFLFHYLRREQAKGRIPVYP